MCYKQNDIAFTEIYAYEYVLGIDSNFRDIIFIFVEISRDCIEYWNISKERFIQ